MALTRTLMIDRMLSSDAAYNGRFITGVLSTGIYCLPSCPARKPKPENVRFFRRPEEAEAAGLRACKRCRPHFFYRDHDPDRILVEDLAERMRQEPQAFRNVEDVVKAAGIGSSKLNELFRRHYHSMPSEMLCRRRIELACRDLLASDRAISEIAFDVGFESLSAFNENFRRLIRLSPQGYRQLAATDRFEIELPAHFNVERSLQYLGRDAASVMERVRGRTFIFAANAGAAQVGSAARIVSVELRPKVAICRIETGGSKKVDATGIHARVIRLLGLVIDPRPFERRASRQADVARLVRGREGLTVPQTATVFDALIWVIAGQQVSLPVAFALRRRLARRVGVRMGDELYAPPTAESIAELEYHDLHAISYSRRKAEYQLDIARMVVDGAFDPEALRRHSATAVERQLLAIRGLGPWSVNYLMMRALGLVDCLPIGDAALTRNLKRFYALEKRPGAEETRRLMEPFAPHRSLATFHVWALQEEYQ